MIPDVLSIGIYPHAYIQRDGEARPGCHVAELNDECNYTDGTAVFRAKLLIKVLTLAKSLHERNNEVNFITAVHKLGYKQLTAPYVREYNLPTTYMLSKTHRKYIDIM